MDPHTVVTSPPPPPGADAAALRKDVRTPVTHHVNAQRSSGSAIAPPHSSASGERSGEPVWPFCSLTASVSATPASFSATSHRNAAVPQGATCPTARSAVDVEPPLHSSFSQASEESPDVGATTAAMMRHSGSRCCSPQRHHCSSTDSGADTVAAGGRLPCAHQVRHDHHQCRRAHHDTHGSHLAGTRKAATATDTAITTVPSTSNRHARTSSRELLLNQDSGTSDVSDRGASLFVSSDIGSHNTRNYDNRTGHRSSETSLAVVEASARAIHSGLHTLSSQALPCVNQETIVERIIGRRPRPYHKWVWRKAENFEELHALSVHGNGYQQPTTTAGRHVVMQDEANDAAAAHSCTALKGVRTTSTPSRGDTSGGASPSSGKVPLRVPPSMAPSDASSSTAPRLVGLLNTRGSTYSAERGTAEASSAPNAATTAASPTKSPSDLNDSPSAGGAKSPRVSSSGTANDMPFEQMSRLSMYTIPTSQQGPAYFNTAIEDGSKTLVIFMMGLPARGKTFLAQKICRLLGWHGSRAKVQNIQVAWRRVLLDWEATHPELVDCSASTGAPDEEAGAFAGETNVTDEAPSGGRGASHEILRSAGAPGGGATKASSHTAAMEAPAWSDSTSSSCLADIRSTPHHATRATPDLVTGSLSASIRRAVPANMNGGSAAASTLKPIAARPTAATTTITSAAATAGHSCSCSLSDGGVASAPLSPASTSIVCRDFSASTVCPSMQAHTAGSLEDGAPIPAATAACASFLPGKRLPAHLTGDAIANSSRGSATQHSPTTATPAELMSVGGMPSLEACAEVAPGTTGGADDSPKLPEVLRARHFRALIEQPTSVARRLYRYVLQSFANDCRLYFQYGGEVVVVNDDFITEELRQEAEQLFRPLASQLFYIEVIRDAVEDPLDFVEYKIRDPAEYPLSDIDPTSAADDFRERLRFLESAYETLKGAPKTKKGVRQPSTSSAADAAPVVETSADSDHAHSAQTGAERGAALPSLPTTMSHSRQQLQQSMLPRSYVKIINANTIEAHGISGYLASRIISYVMNLSQVKMQHPIYFVRHGESSYNAENRIGGNPLLTGQGVQDAVALLEFLGSLKRHLEHVDHLQRTHQHRQQLPHSEANGGDAESSSAAAASPSSTANTLEMWTSQLQRAIQTTELSERLLGIRTLRWSSLNDIHAGICEDMTYAEVRQQYPLIEYFRKRNKYSFRYPEGESYQDLVVRLEPVIMELENADKVVVVVAHQAVLRCLLAYFGSTSAESSIDVVVPHRTIWRCTYDSKGIASLDELKLDASEADHHLPRGKDSLVTSPTNIALA
ncbi:hypothetical protein LSCM1_07339 [Leishmania martiniquensis]|uniref:6-phosphofructo-2-kinase domain-containing protein n=1 Tax=Leishmania martiniquensis TaxID=1580590 RepID=A0A836H7H1_9TRYP|nr:hypothetical protein LSCM1_07339 [Leishmania martiniquensis]